MQSPHHEGKAPQALATAPRRSGTTTPATARGLLGLQRTAGNAAVSQVVAQRAPDPGQLAQIHATTAAVVDRATGQQGPPPDPAQEAAIRARQRAAFAQPDQVGPERAKVRAAAAETKEAARPTAPPGRPATPTLPAGRTPDAATPAAAVADARAAVERATAVDVPAPSPPVAPPAFAPPVDAGGRPVPGNPEVDLAAAGLAIRLQHLRHQAHGLATEAAAGRARGHALAAGLHTARGKVAEADTSISTVRGHVDQRRAAADQARAALTASTEKAAVVSAQAPGFAAQSEEGRAKSGPMTDEARQLGGQASAVRPDDADAAAKAGEQAGQVNRIGNDLGSIDGAIGVTGQRAADLVDEAAQATRLNSEAGGRIAGTEATLDATTGKLDSLHAQNTRAKAELDALAGGPAELHAGAAALDDKAQAGLNSSTALEARLHATQNAYLAGMSAVPARRPRQAPPVQRVAYADRERVDTTGWMPSWLSGEEPRSARERAEQSRAAEERRLAELRQIDAEAHHDFASLSAGQKAALAGRMTFSRLTGSLSSTNWPKFGLTLLRGFVDPRVSLSGVLSGLGMVLSGGANLFSARQWEKDPVGNLLKSAADIATGVTIVLGSVAGLAIAIIAICAAAILLTLGAATVVCGPIITFCASVAATVGPWAVEMAGIALVLNGFVLIKNLVDAATAATATRLRAEAEDMAADTETMGMMAMQIAGDKAGKVVGPRIAGAVGAVEAGLNSSTSAAANALGAAVGDIRTAVAAGRPFGSGGGGEAVPPEGPLPEGAVPEGNVPESLPEAPATPEPTPVETAPAPAEPTAPAPAPEPAAPPTREPAPPSAQDTAPPPAQETAPAATQDAAPPPAQDAAPVPTQEPAPTSAAEPAPGSRASTPELGPVDLPDGVPANDNAIPPEWDGPPANDIGVPPGRAGGTRPTGRGSGGAEGHRHRRPGHRKPAAAAVPGPEGGRRRGECRRAPRERGQRQGRRHPLDRFGGAVDGERTHRTHRDAGRTDTRGPHRGTGTHRGRR
ncbi:hypothetical protein ACFYOT_34875 [Saccharothrix saharensis]|uniref:hypothetical protein n=1 Tax=Saccharothrix saharensis TaxID=571190 RepID=UPI003679E648